MCSSVFRAIKDEEDVLFIAVKKIGRLKLQLIIKKKQGTHTIFLPFTHITFLEASWAHIFMFYISFFPNPKKKSNEKNSYA